MNLLIRARRQPRMKRKRNIVHRKINQLKKLTFLHRKKLSDKSKRKFSLL
jgi:hypothetical protein